MTKLRGFKQSHFNIVLVGRRAKQSHNGENSVCWVKGHTVGGHEESEADWTTPSLQAQLQQCILYSTYIYKGILFPP